MTRLIPVRTSITSHVEVGMSGILSHQVCVCVCVCGDMGGYVCGCMRDSVGVGGCV